MWSLISPIDIKSATAIDATNIRRFSKRIVDSSGLNEGGEDIQSLEKTQRKG